MLRFAAVSAFVLCLACSAKGAVEFYVSPAGNDANAGTQDKPFATLDRAKKAVATRADHAQKTTVWLAGGTYHLPETLVFQSADSGQKEGPVTYAALPGQTPVISGGQVLHLTWSDYKGGIMQAPVPQGTTGDQLFVNGQRQIMSRYPNYDANASPFNGVAADAFQPLAHGFQISER